MTISSLTYTPPIRRDVVASTLEYDLLETAQACFDSGDFEGSARAVLAHLFPASPPVVPGAFAFTQGSSHVSVTIDDGMCTVSVPLVRVPAGGGVAALRYVLQRINGSGQLHQARLRGDDIHLEFREKLSSLHPQKLVEALRRMPSAADQHDDWMIDQFGVQPLDRGRIDALDDAELDRAEDVWRVHWHEVDELLKEAQRKRSLWFLNELTAYAIHRVRFALPLAGKLLPRLLESSGTWNDTDVDPMKRETSLGKFAREMKALPGDELRGSLGHLTYAISPHSEGTPDKLAEYFGDCGYMDSIDKHRKSHSPIDAALPLVSTYYYLLAVHGWPPEVSEALKHGLAEASEKPWRETANFLFEHARDLVEQLCADEDDDDGDASDSEDEEQ